ncbi:MAG TPA: hypothetical protein VGF34_20635 [Stellaceae bacterium]|jgi:hypothetical protein
MISISSALDDPALLAPAFPGASWATWRSTILAAEGLPLDQDQLALFRAVADRDPPRRRVRELWAIAGRRSGKDSIASGIATVAALNDYGELLRPGERASVICLAVDRTQAKIVHRYIAGYFNTVPLLRPLIVRETDETIELTNGVEIVVATNSYRSVRGRTIVCAIFDEVSYWRDDDSANPDFETYNAVIPGLVTLPGAMLVGISTPYRRGGLLFDRWRRCYGQPDDDVLVVHGPSTAFNPLLPQSVIDQAIERDPEAAAAEWLAEWRSDIADFVDRLVLESLVVPGRHELPPVPGIPYFGFVDPSGGSSDSMTLAVAHRGADDRAVLDAVREVRPPFSPESVVEEFAALLKSYQVFSVTGDRYAGEWPREQFRKHGVEYLTSDKPKSDIYRELLPLLNAGSVELLDNPRLVSQICGLERRTVRGGRDSIDHPRAGRDDLANSAGGAIVMASAGSMSSWDMLVEESRRAELERAVAAERLRIEAASAAERSRRIEVESRLIDTPAQVWIQFSRPVGVAYVANRAFPASIQQFQFVPGIHCVPRVVWDQHEQYLRGAGAWPVNQVEEAA